MHLIPTAVEHGEVESREAQSLALRVDTTLYIYIYKVLIKAGSLLAAVEQKWGKVGFEQDIYNSGG